MKTIHLTGTDIVAPNVALGVVRIHEKTDAEIRELYATAREVGINFFDHAAVYGGEMHRCEARFAEALRLGVAEREQIRLQTKAGIVRKGKYYDSTNEDITRSVDASLKALQTDYIDILLLHRPDVLVEPEAVARAFDELQAAGKVRHFGVSNHTPGQITLLRKHVKQPLVVNQLQLSITHAPMVAQGIVSNMAGVEQSIMRDGGVLDYCRLHDITVQAWSPMRAGFFTGTFLGDPEYAALNTTINNLAMKYDVPPVAIAIAWITRHPANMQVMLGTTNSQRVADSVRGSDIPLMRSEWYDLTRAAGHTVP